jgi:hypothetical protein
MKLDPAINAVRKGTLAYVGAIALTSDLVGEAFQRFADRGAAFERTARERLDHATSGARKRFEQATRDLRKELRIPLANGHEQTPAAGNLLVQGRQRILSVLNIPTQETLHELNKQVDHLSLGIDDLRAKMHRAKAEAHAEPLPGYDKMNVDSVVSQLAKVDEAGLRAVRAYEQEHGKRVTVLRAIEERLVLKPEA